MQHPYPKTSYNQGFLLPMFTTHTLLRKHFMTSVVNVLVVSAGNLRPKVQARSKTSPIMPDAEAFGTKGIHKLLI